MSPHETDQLARGLVAKLRGGDGAARVQSAIRLSEMGCQAWGALRDLLAALHDHDAGVRRVAAWVLGHVGAGHPEVARALDRASGDGDPGVRRVARSARALVDLQRAA